MYASLAGVYQPGLTFDQSKVLAAKLSPATRAAMLSAAVAALPRCYSQRFRDCIHDVGPASPECATIMEGYVANWDAMEKLVTDMPYCTEPIKPIVLVGGAAAVFALGLGLGFLLK